LRVIHLFSPASYQKKSSVFVCFRVKEIIILILVTAKQLYTPPYKYVGFIYLFAVPLRKKFFDTFCGF